MQVWQVQADGDVPALSFLGEGGSYSVGEGYNFIVKARHPYHFITMPGPEYTAREGERVWSVLGDFDAPAAENQNTTVVGPVQKGCVIDFATIDDDEDERINYFTLDGGIIYAMGQGLTTRGRFYIPRDGTLGYIANDSIGMFLNVCEKKVTLTPTMTVTPTATLEPTFTPSPTFTPTMTLSPTATLTRYAHRHANHDGHGDDDADQYPATHDADGRARHGHRHALAQPHGDQGAAAAGLPAHQLRRQRAGSPARPLHRPGGRRPLPGRLGGRRRLEG
ncbi:MAG: hypothetical protein IPH95_07085 [Candidatus Promineofilum sp.]|nr:hypothetical protein [Promineifilum sp.]